MAAKQRPDSLPDDDLITEVMPPLLVMAGFSTAFAFGLLLLLPFHKDIWPYALIGAMVVSIWMSGRLFRRGRLRLSGMVISYALTLIPVLSTTSFGFTNNPLIYLAVTGVTAAGMLISPAAPFRVAWTALAALFFLLCFPFLIGQKPVDLTQILLIGLSMGVLLLSSAALAWTAGYAVRGTIKWALETADKAERREQLLRDTQSELEQALRDRDQLNDRLYKTTLALETARAESEAAFRSKASFMATMSHELRTPLNIIIGFSTAMIDHPEIYEGDPLSSAVVADLSEIRRSGQHLLNLINDILDLARVEAGRLELNKTTLHLVSMLDEMVHVAQGLISDRPVLLRREYHGPLPGVVADEGRIRQVLLNLVSNACKFTSVGEIAIGARADADIVTLWVRDTGIGIAEIDQTRIFNQFEQVENHDAKQHTGTGLGLSICRWLVELHGGTMWLQSELGKGSIFYFTLPRVQKALNGSLSPEEARSLVRNGHSIGRAPGVARGG